MKSLVFRVILLVYALTLCLLQPILALYLLKRAVRQPEYRLAWGQRFLANVPRLPKASTKRIWVHAVSVGEANAISPLVQHWAKVYPEHEWVISCTTPTGMARCRQLYSSLCQVHFFYLPYDLPWLVAKTLRRIQAQALWLVETELWPHWVLGASKAGLHTVLLNARVSPRTGQRLQRLAWVSRPVLQGLKTVVCQTQADAQVFSALGRPVDLVCGNLKFDVPLQPELANLGKAWRDELQAAPVLLFASSRDGEEEVLLDAMVKTQFFKRMPNACVLLVPRHPQRFDEVFELMAQAAGRLGVARPVRRSAWNHAQAVSNGFPSKVLDNGVGQVRLVLGDSMGEMPAYYSAADLAFLGGSWLPFGGQNLIEACAYGCPVWMGPHTFNFSKASRDALEAGAARRFESLATACEAFLGHAFDVSKDRKAAFAYARNHRGATLRSFDALNQASRHLWG